MEPASLLQSSAFLACCLRFRSYIGLLSARPDDIRIFLLWLDWTDQLGTLI